MQFNGLDRNLTLVLMRSLAIVSYMDMVRFATMKEIELKATHWGS